MAKTPTPGIDQSQGTGPGARLLLLMVILALGAAGIAEEGAPAPTASGPDGMVTGLPDEVFDVLFAVKKRNPGPLTEADARILLAAIQKDGVVDETEHDFLVEHTSELVRSISSTRGQPRPGESAVVTFPAFGTAREVFDLALHPRPDFEAEWAQGMAGFAGLIAYHQVRPANEEPVIAFIQAKIAEQWKLSNQANAYRPLRDILAKSYDWSMKLGGKNVKIGRGILFQATTRIDRAEGDSVPDFLYDWINPEPKKMR